MLKAHEGKSTNELLDLATDYRVIMDELGSEHTSYEHYREYDHYRELYKSAMCEAEERILAAEHARNVAMQAKR